MIAQELEVCLHMAFVNARQDRHEFITVEHLLLALLDSSTAVKVLRTAGADPAALRPLLIEHIAKHVTRAAAGRDVDTQPTLSFQRVIQRAILQIQSSGKKEVTGADALAAIHGEKDSYAALLLGQKGITEASAVPPLSGAPFASELQASVDAGFARAHRDAHEFFTLEHVLLALLDNPSAARVLRGCSVNMHALRKTLTEHIAKHAPRAGRKVEPQPAPGVQRLSTAAIERAARMGMAEVAGADVLVAILGEKDSLVAQVLERHGITRFDAVFYLTHGVAPASASSEPDLPEGADLQVVLYNDDYTPMEFVVGVLEKFFSMTQDDAKETMLEVHRNGIGLCGLFAREQAVELMKAVVDHARRHGHPLNCAVLAPKLP